MQEETAIILLRGRRLMLQARLSKLIHLKKREVTVEQIKDLTLINLHHHPFLLVSKARLQKEILLEGLETRHKNLQERCSMPLTEVTNYFRR